MQRHLYAGRTFNLFLLDGEWLPRRAFSVLHVKSTDAEEITHALTTYIGQKELEYTKLVGQGYDGASALFGVHSGVQKRMRVHAAHALYIHCSCHRW